jgi:flagellar assembly protein FliH
MMGGPAISLPGAPVEVRVVPPPQQPAKPAPPADGLAAERAALAAQRAALAQATAAARSAAEQLAAMARQLASEAEGHIVDLAIEVARKVLMQEIQAGRCDIDPIVREALSRVPARGDVLVRLSAADLAACNLAADSPQTVRFVADPSISRGECVVESREGSVISAIEPHLEEIAQALKAP